MELVIQMEDDRNGRRLKWKTTEMEDHRNGRPLKWKTKSGLQPLVQGCVRRSCDKLWKYGRWELANISDGPICLPQIYALISSEVKQNTVVLKYLLIHNNNIHK